MSKRSGLAARFTEAEKTAQYRTIAALSGETSTGRTYHALTAGGPIVYHDIDLCSEGVIDKFVDEGKEIYHEKYVWIPGDPDNVDDDAEASDLQTFAREVRDTFLKNFHYAAKEGARTQIIDTESRFWQVFRYAEFGSPKGDNPKDFDELNQRFESIVAKAKATPGMNLFMIRSMKDQWGAYGKANPSTGKKGFAKSGRREEWGYEHLPGLMYMELMFRHLEENDPLRERVEEEWGAGSAEYAITIGKCKHAAERQFTTIPRMTFPELGELLVDGSTQDDWS